MEDITIEIKEKLQKCMMNQHDVTVRTVKNGYIVSIRNCRIAPQSIKDKAEQFTNEANIEVRKVKNFSSVFGVPKEIIATLEKAFESYKEKIGFGDLRKIIGFYVPEKNLNIDDYFVTFAGNGEVKIFCETNGFIKIFKTNCKIEDLTKKVIDELYNDALDRSYALYKMTKKSN